jgi:para-nitrobenzyl esterase
MTIFSARGTPVPLIIGSNREESTTLGDDPQTPLTADAYAARIHAEFDVDGPGIADRILTLYPAGAYDSPMYALIAVHSDMLETCQVRSLALTASIARTQPVWRYLFTHRLQTDFTLNAARAFHGEELYFVFGNLATILGTDYAMTPGELLLGERTMNAWANFAAHGNPNGFGPFEWRRYEARNEAILQLDERAALLAGYHIPQCEFLSALPQP